MCFTFMSVHARLYTMIASNTPISAITGIGPSYAQKLEKLHIKTVGDLINHVPFRYENYASIKQISQAQLGEEVTIVGTIWDVSTVYTRSYRIKTITKAVIQDGSGTIEAIWFNQAFLRTNLKQGMRISLSGKLKQNRYKLQLSSPAYEVLHEDEQFINTGRIIPVYPETEGVSSKWLRTKIAKLLPEVIPTTADWLPFTLRQKAELLVLSEALQKIHFPESDDDAASARKRLATDELLKVHLSALKRKSEWENKSKTEQLTCDKRTIDEFIKKLPFTLTNAQFHVIDEILDDLSKPIAMNRLLEGDVGSGKTVVAALAMYVAHQNGLQSALMAPTAILATQHYQTLEALLSPFGLTTSLITGRSKIKIKNSKQNDANMLDTRYSIQNTDVVIGTHALLSESTQFNNLGFVVIDEQHKFGVEQRATLRQKGKQPHVLTMTATPIPRTLALTLYGNLDLSVIDEMPVGRTPPKTYVVPNKKREDAYKFIEKEIKQNKVQAFVVCPLIDESETYNTVKAATVEYGRLSKEVFPKLKLGLLHGRMKPKEKDEVMEQFREKKLDILVATPVVEVGVDIPNATIILIEAADRFGLAQLHQLRGRVGRRAGQISYCLLFTELKGAQSIRRLKAMEKIFNGIELAELDLKLRGVGEIFGTMQHGIPDFKAAKLSNLKMIEETRLLAKEIFDDYFLKGDRGVQQVVSEFDQRLIEPN